MEDPYINFSIGEDSFLVTKITYEKKKRIEKNYDQLQIYNDDTIQNIVHKITLKEDNSCSDQCLYLWMEDHKKTYPLQVSYQEKELTNPYLEKTYDSDFVNEDNTKKMDVSQIYFSSRIIESFLEEYNISNKTIYVCSLNDYLQSEHFKELSDKIEPAKIFYGLLQKYFHSLSSLEELQDKTTILRRRQSISYLLQKNQKQNKSYATKGKGGKHAVLEYKILKKLE